jgi:hypothetical protein
MGGAQWRWTAERGRGCGGRAFCAPAVTGCSCWRWRSCCAESCPAMRQLPRSAKDEEQLACVALRCVVLCGVCDHRHPARSLWVRGLVVFRVDLQRACWRHGFLQSASAGCARVHARDGALCSLASLCLEFSSSLTRPFTFLLLSSSSYAAPSSQQAASGCSCARRSRPAAPSRAAAPPASALV